MVFGQRVSLLSAIALVVGLPASSATAQHLVGRVFDSTTGEPVPGAEVAVLAPNGVDLVGLAVSDTTGFFDMPVATTGRFGLVVNAAGYEPVGPDSVTIGREERVHIEVIVGPRPLDVEGVRVVARRGESLALQEFYERQERYEALGLGLILDREVLERHQGTTADAALVRESINVSTSTSSGGPMPRIIVKRWRQEFGKPPWCTPAFFIDGFLVDDEAFGALPVSSLEGLELFRGPSELPAEYSWAPRAMDCGVILAWTSRQGRPGLPDHTRPLLVGAYLATAGFDPIRPDVAGAELEVGMARGLAGWVAVGLVPEECTAPTGMSCPELGVPWAARIGVNLYPTGDDLPVTPYVGAGYGVGSPGTRVVAVHLWRFGVEMALGRTRFRVELRSGPGGMGAGVELLY
jgi:hypothetical protein